MKIRLAALLLPLLLACSSAPAVAGDPEQADWNAYSLSVALPSITRWCSPVLADPAGFQADADAWRRTNQAAVSRGQALATDKVPAGWSSPDQYLASRLSELETLFKSRSAAKQVQVCTMLRAQLLIPIAEL